MNNAKLKQLIVYHLSKCKIQSLKHYSRYIGIIFLTLGCSATDSSFKLPDNAKELIAGANSKEWKLSKRFNKEYRMNMEGYFLSYIITYNSDGTFSDNNGKHRGCIQSLKGTWDLVTNENGQFLKVESPQIPEIMGIEEEFKMLKILNLQDLEMQVQSVHEEYTDSGKLVDYLVPIEVEVPDRRFKY